MSNNYAYLAIYMSNFFLISIILSSVGGLIPFLAAELAIDEREYSIIFTLLSLTNILAAFLYKTLERRTLLPKLHTFCLICAMGMAVSALLMASMRTKTLQCLMLAVFNLFSYALIIVTNICLILAAPVEDVGRWLSYAHGFYGMGGLVGPILVGIFRQDVFLLEAAACLGLATAYRFLASPELILRRDQGQYKKGEEDNTDNTGRQLIQGSSKLQIFLSLGFFFISGIETTIQSWTPSFAVLTQVSSKSEAVRFPAIFWAFSTFFRFFFGWLQVSGRVKMVLLVTSQMVTGVVCCLLAWGGAVWVLPYFGAVFYGFSMSQLFPLLLGVSREFGISFTDGEVANMVISTTISPLLSTLTGVLMANGINWLFFSLLVYGTVLYAVSRMILGNFEKEAKEEKGIELSLIAKL